MDYKPFVEIDFEPNSAPSYVKQGYNIVVIDVLRATSTIIVALAQGAKEVIACVDIEETKSYKKSHDAITIGERFGEKLPEFDFRKPVRAPFQRDLERASLPKI